MKSKGLATEVKVGTFVIVVLVAFLTIVVIMTSKSEVFKKTYILHTEINNVVGLIEGSEVRLAGMEVGYVKSMEFIEKVGKLKVHIAFSVNSDVAKRISKDSKVTLDTMGLLGKKYLSIISGDPKKGTVSDGQTLEGVEPIEISQALNQLGGVVNSIVDAAAALKNLLESIQGKGPKTDLADAIASLKKIIERVEKGPGAMHALIYDPNREKIIADLSATAQNLKEVTEQVKTGEGTLHELIYGTKGKELAQNLASASASLVEIVKSVKEKRGLLHQLIYEEERGQIIADLSTTAQNLKDISETIKRGEGTVGGLITDPTVYEDIKKITGGLERNKMLKIFVRHLISSKGK